MKIIGFILILTSLISAQKAKINFVELPSVFSSNMVLQQKTEVTFWGKANPAQKIFVKAGWGYSASTFVKPDSSWQVKLKTIQAGGPYNVIIKAGDSTVTLSNVVLGEVWFCSGQSNMEIPLEGWKPEYPIKNSEEEIKKADYPNIRLFNVSKVTSIEPKFNCNGKWRVCTQEDAANFSAVGYFFGRDLYKELHVPIGLICAAWGGTKIQPWIQGSYLSKLHIYKPEVEKLLKARAVYNKFYAWRDSHRIINIENKNLQSMWSGLNFDDSDCSKINFDDNKWKSMNLPAHWSSVIGAFYGAVWFRKKINIPAGWKGTNLVLQLGAIADMDEAWVNDIKIGEHFGGGLWGVPRVYKIPGKIVDGSTLTVAVRVIANGGGGGITGGKDKMLIYPEGNSEEGMSISGKWKYMPVAEFAGRKFYVYGPNGEFYKRPKVPFQIQQNTSTALYNGMVAPVIPYRIKGVIWYQGESNSGNPNDYNNYKFLFPLLIKNWRNDWKEGSFPFYWVQIAPFKYGKKSKSYVVRNAQRQTLSVPNTGMAVTLDIGSVNNIHPPDKQDVGLRLALWALDKNYGRHVNFSGPIYKSMKVEKEKAIISFKYANGGLVVKHSNGKTNFLIAGKDSSFVKAKVKVFDTKLIVYNPKVKHPLAVRYAWSNADRATLFNKAGLPASTFRTDDWKP